MGSEKCAAHRTFTLTANKAMHAILHVAKHLWQKAFHFLRRLGEIPQQGVRRRTIPTHREVSMKIRFVVALVGLAISFAPPAFAQQKDTVDPETAQQVRALASNY